MLAEPCTCSRCGTKAAAIHREHLAQIEIDPARFAEFWHAYHPHYERVLRSVPARARRAIGEARETSALSKLRAWSDKTGDYAHLDDALAHNNIAVVSGPPGTGKTVAAVWCAVHRWADRDPVFISAMELARLPRYGEERERVLDAGVLIIDDLGVERADEKFTADFDEIIDRFYQGYGDLVITTNCTAAEFRRRYGVRVVDRLTECGTWIPATGKSLRGGK